MKPYRFVFNNGICEFCLSIEIWPGNDHKLQELGDSIARQLGATFYYAELVED